MKINNIKELNIYLESLFNDKSNFENVEWAEIENGKKIKISIKFWRGPFNKSSIKFEYISSYSKEILSNHLTMAIFGSLTVGSYHYKLNKNKIKIYKDLEVY